MKTSLIRRAFLILTVLACVGLAPTPALAEYPAEFTAYPGDEPSAAAMAADFLLVRPLGLAATIGGLGIFVLSLPFSVLGGNVEVAAHMLIAEPGAYTFGRPLGEFD